MSGMFTITIEGLEDALRDWKQATEALVHGLREGVKQGLSEGERWAKAEHRYKDQTGDLTRSISSALTGWGDMSADGELIAGESYASFVEEGTRAHPIDPKPSNPRGLLAWEEPQGAWHHAAHVNHPGTPSLPFMGPALLKFERVFQRELEIGEAKAAEIMSRGR